jgi:hypothetical protein
MTWCSARTSSGSSLPCKYFTSSLPQLLLLLHAGQGRATARQLRGGEARLPRHALTGQLPSPLPPPLSKRRNCAPGSWLLALLRRTRVTTDAGAHAGLCQCHIQIRGRGRRCPYAGQPRLATFSAADESSIVPGMPTIVVRITLSELTNPTAPQHRYLCFSTHPPSLGYEYSSNTSATTSPTLNSMALGSYLH